MAILEDATLIKATLVSPKTFAQRPAGVAPHPGFGVPPNPVLAPRRILEAGKDGAPIRNVPEAPLPDLDSIDVNLTLDAEMQLAPLFASVPPPPGFGALSNLVRAEEQQSAAAPILKVEQVLDAPLTDVDLSRFDLNSMIETFDVANEVNKFKKKQDSQDTG